MVGMNAIISNNVLTLLKQEGKSQNELAEILGVSRQMMCSMLSGSRTINAVELQRIAAFLHVSKEKLTESSSEGGHASAVYSLVDKVKTDSARRSLAIIDEMANMVLFYARVRLNAEELERAWEA